MLCLCREPTSKTLHVVPGTYSGAFNVQQRKPGVLLESRKSGHQILSRLFFFFFLRTVIFRLERNCHVPQKACLSFKAHLKVGDDVVGRGSAG